MTAIAIERRAAGWYHFTGTKWVRSASQAAATSAAKRLVVTLSGTTWSVKLTGVTKGLLRVVAHGSDRLGNTSANVVKQQTLTS